MRNMKEQCKVMERWIHIEKNSQISAPDIESRRDYLKCGAEHKMDF
jgi:hypothetical protein